MRIAESLELTSIWKTVRGEKKGGKESATTERNKERWEQCVTYFPSGDSSMAVIFLRVCLSLPKRDE